MAIIVPGTPSSFHAPPINTTLYVNGRKTYYTANMENVEGVLGVPHGGTGNKTFKDGEVVIYSGGKLISAGINKNELSVLAGITGTLTDDTDDPSVTTVTIYTASDGSYYKKSETGDGYDHYSPLGDPIEGGLTKAEFDQMVSDGDLTEGEQKTGANVTTTYVAQDGTYYAKSEDGSGYTKYNENGEIVQTGFTKEQVEQLITDGTLTTSQKVEHVSDTRSLVERLNDKIGAIKTANGATLDKDDGADSVTLPDFLLKTGGTINGNLQVNGGFAVGNVTIVHDPITGCITFKPVE